MSADDLVRAAGKEINRRTVLRRLGTGTLATVTMLLGMQGVAQATIKYKCCNLCHYPSSSCSGCACYWCWTCCDSSSGRRNYRCCECHTKSIDCGKNCNYVPCSMGVPISGGC